MLTVDVPRVLGLDPKLPAPVIRARAIYIEPGGTATELASTEESQLNVHLGAAGAYRIEVSITPRHLGPYLGALGPELANVELPWIYSSPFYVQ
jgi:hypothetical protein